LVTDGEQRSALGVTRSLGRAGHEVLVCSYQARPLAGASRFARGAARSPNPLTEPEAFAGAVRRLAMAWRADVLIPVTDQSYLAVLGSREPFGDVKIPGPDLPTFRQVSDKASLLTAAERVGIAVPRQWVVSDPNAPPPADLCYPLAVKPARSVVDGGRFVATYARDVKELGRRLALFPSAAFPLLLQQRIAGPGTGVFLLIWNGRTVAAFAHRRLREFPPSGGTSTYCTSVPLPDQLRSRSERLLQSFGWQGVAMVEYKVDSRTGQPFLMEVNGRFWGSLQLAIDAGVDFPRLLVDAACGRPAPHPPEYRVGVRMRSWWSDVDHLIARLRWSLEDLGLPHPPPGRWAALLDFLPWRPGQRDDVLRLNDPRPFLRESAAWVRHRLLSGEGP